MMQQLENRMVIDELEDEKTVCYICAQCGEPIYEGDEYIKFGLTKEEFHEDCFNDFLDEVCLYLTAEKEDL